MFSHIEKQTHLPGPELLESTHDSFGVDQASTSNLAGIQRQVGWTSGQAHIAPCRGELCTSQQMCFNA